MSSRRYGRATASAFLRIFSLFSLFMLVAVPLITTAQENATPPVEDQPTTAMINVSVTSDAGDTTGTSVCLNAECQTWAGTILTFIVPVTSDITWTATPVSGLAHTHGLFIFQRGVTLPINQGA